MGTVEKEQALTLLDQLAPAQRTATLRFMESLLADPVARSLADAPVDDEPLTTGEEQALAASQEWFRHHQGTPHEEVLAEFGLKPEEYPWNIEESGPTRR